MPRVEFLSAAVFMGMLFGGMLTGYISDRFGRKFALLLALGLNFLAGMFVAFMFRNGFTLWQVN